MRQGINRVLYREPWKDPESRDPRAIIEGWRTTADNIRKELYRRVDIARQDVERTRKAVPGLHSLLPFSTQKKEALAAAQEVLDKATERLENHRWRAQEGSQDEYIRAQRVVSYRTRERELWLTRPDVIRAQEQLRLLQAVVASAHQGNAYMKSALMDGNVLSAIQEQKRREALALKKSAELAMLLRRSSAKPAPQEHGQAFAWSPR